MNLQRILIGVFAILVMVAGTFSFLNTFELKETKEYIGFRGEAKTNNLFAARLFLKRMGIPAERKDTFLTLPDTDTVLLIDTERYTLSRQKIDEILAWVKRGGHLITRARIPSGNATLYSNNDSESGDENTPTPKEDALQTTLGITTGKHVLPEDDDLPLKAELSDMEHPLEVDPEFFYSLETDAGQAYPQKYGDAVWLLEKKWGKGMVTLVANLDFIENPALNTYDHAEFLWHMIHSLHDAPRAVWLVHQDDMPPLWKLLWKHAWALLLTLACLVPLTILALSPRFGPQIPALQAERRRILEHIHASGLFMWQRYTKHDDKQYQPFVDIVEQLYPGTRKHHDK
jgi:hypothetical protein